MGGSVSKAVSGVTKSIKNAGKNLQSGGDQFLKGAQQLGSGDLKGLQTMGAAAVNTPSSLYGNLNNMTAAGIEGLYSPLKGTPLYGMTAGNIIGGLESAEGITRGNLAGIQALPTDIGKGVQHGLDQIKGGAEDLLGGLKDAFGGGGGGGSGGVSAPQYYKELAEKQANYGMNLPDEFQAYERDRFVEPSDRTVRGEGLLADRVDDPSPYTSAINFAKNAAGYESGFESSPLNLSGPTANSYENLNAGMQNVNAGMRNVNAGMQAQTFGNANTGLQGPVNYQQQRSLRDAMQDFQDPYTDRVVNQTMRDMDRARQMTANQISGDATKAGAFGGSRAALMQAENNRNFADRTAAAVGQLRSQGFQQAADLAQQENLQRLGLSAADVQDVRGLQSQGNLQGQSLTAGDLRDVRGLQSQGALNAQNLQSQGALNAQNLQSQGALAAQGLGAQSDRDAMNYGNQLQMQGNALGVDQARMEEQFNQDAGALNLQGALALGDLNQMDTSDGRQRIQDLLAAGQAEDMRGQQQADFDYQQFVDETQRFPAQYLNNLQQSGGLAQSLISGPQPQKNPNSGLLNAAGMGLSTYGMLAGIPAAAGIAGPAALGMGALGLLAS